MSAFYVTTPIYYVNDRPHIGTAYSTIAADVLARYHRLRGEPTRFLTGLDEHGQKIERRAQELGMDPQRYVDAMTPPFKDAWQALSCAYDDFIRTTDARHKARAQELWLRCQAKGDIYEAEYQGHYCVGCEAYYTEKDLRPGGLCPMHNKPADVLKEKTLFFRLSAYTDKLLDYYDRHPKFVQPEARYNEVKSFVREGLRDLSISRGTFKWGVPVPGKPEHVIYVWFDALVNYMSALDGPPRAGEKSPLFEQFWEPNARVVHLVGKDILRFHAVYWPAFLMSADLPPPSQIWAHGWLTVDGQKMSKSLGNFIAPGPISDAVGADVLRYYLMRDIAFGQDGDFSHTSLFARYHGELGNGLGNLLQRVVSSIVKNSFGGRVPSIDASALTDLDRALMSRAEVSARTAAMQLEEVNPNRALDAIWELVTAANKYVDQTEPWKLAKQGDLERLGAVVYTVLESLRFLGIMLWPFMPQKCDALLTQLGLNNITTDLGHDLWPTAFGGLPGGTQTRAATPLFPRFDKEQEAALITKLQPKVTMQDKPEHNAAGDLAATAAAPAAVTELAPAKDNILIDDFARADLRVALIVLAERVPKSDKLLRLEVDLGPLGRRQILAGLGKHYAPEDVIGRRVVVLANLPPRKMMGLESQGMVLAAGDGHTLAVLNPQKDMPPGSAIS